MKLLVFVCLFTVSVGASFPFEPELDEYWENFKKMFHKSYNQYEESARRLIWENSVAEIARHNLDADLGVHSFKIGLNQYSDMSKEEWSNKMSCLKPRENFVSNGSAWLPPMNAEVPDRVDWREKGFVTEVKNQGHCGSCYAFSATGALEGQLKRKTGKLVSLSEQNIVDCSYEEGNEGCNGGWADVSFQYVKRNNGIDTEKSYPYENKEDKCHFKKSSIGATCTGYVYIPSGDEEALKIAVATVGPISVSMHADFFFKTYQSGIFNPPEECRSDTEGLNHAVLVVGYGSENGKDYWLVKNSWGEWWGDKGYMKIIRNENMCGIATKANYPLM